MAKPWFVLTWQPCGAFRGKNLHCGGANKKIVNGDKLRWDREGKEATLLPQKKRQGRVFADFSGDNGWRKTVATTNLMC
jgi:hypothetical protein